MFEYLSSRSSVPNRLRDKDKVGLVSLEAGSQSEKTAAWFPGGSAMGAVGGCVRI